MLMLTVIKVDNKSIKLQ